MKDGVGTSPGVVITGEQSIGPNVPFVTTYNLNNRPLRNDYMGFVGMALTVGANNIPVSSLGRICVSGNSLTQHPYWHRQSRQPGLRDDRN